MHWSWQDFVLWSYSEELSQEALVVFKYVDFISEIL